MANYFENKSEITLEKYLYQCNNPIGKKTKKELLRWKSIQAGGMGIMTVTTILFITAEATPLCAVSVALFLAFAYNLFIKRNRQNKKLYSQILRNQPDGKWVRTIIFDKDIKVTDGNTVTTFKYNEFVKFTENDKYYLIFKNENAVLRVEKGCFTAGNEADFVSFMKRRINKQK